MGKIKTQIVAEETMEFCNSNRSGVHCELPLGHKTPHAVQLRNGKVTLWDDPA